MATPFERIMGRFETMPGYDPQGEGADNQSNPAETMLGMISSMGGMSPYFRNMLLRRAGALDLLSQARSVDPQNDVRLPGSFISEAMKSMQGTGGFGGFARGILDTLFSTLRNPAEAGGVVSDFWRNPDRLAGLMMTPYAGGGQISAFLSNRLKERAAELATGGGEFTVGNEPRPDTTSEILDFLLKLPLQTRALRYLHGNSGDPSRIGP